MKIVTIHSCKFPLQIPSISLYLEISNGRVFKCRKILLIFSLGFTRNKFKFKVQIYLSICSVTLPLGYAKCKYRSRWNKVRKLNEIEIVKCLLILPVPENKSQILFCKMLEDKCTTGKYCSVTFI